MSSSRTIPGATLPASRLSACRAAGAEPAGLARASGSRRCLPPPPARLPAGLGSLEECMPAPVGRLAQCGPLCRCVGALRAGQLEGGVRKWPRLGESESAGSGPVLSHTRAARCLTAGVGHGPAPARGRRGGGTGRQCLGGRHCWKSSGRAAGRRLQHAVALSAGRGDPGTRRPAPHGGMRALEGRQRRLVPHCNHRSGLRGGLAGRRHAAGAHRAAPLAGARSVGRWQASSTMGRGLAGGGLHTRTKVGALRCAAPRCALLRCAVPLRPTPTPETRLKGFLVLP